MFWAQCMVHQSKLISQNLETQNHHPTTKPHSLSNPASHSLYGMQCSTDYEYALFIKICNRSGHHM